MITSFKQLCDFENKYSGYIDSAETMDQLRLIQSMVVKVIERQHKFMIPLTKTNMEYYDVSMQLVDNVAPRVVDLIEIKGIKLSS